MPKTCKILIVDDRSVDRRLMRKILESSGYMVQEAADGRQALETARLHKPDLIISDALMPVMDGFQFCKAVKGDKDLNHIPFIFYTATFTEEKDQELVLKIGADKFIRKPAEPDKFIEIIQSVIRDMEKGKIKPRKAVSDSEKEVFKLYSERLVKKLEQKMLDLEKEIAERKRAEEERKKLEAQLHQAQKMEAIGTLASGVAHDFNNILTTIIGNAEIALMDVIKDESLRKGIEEIKKAGEKAASLTRQLLAFSRKQIVQPKILNINELLTDIEKMLGRLIGEDIELLTIPEAALWQVEIDPGQIEQMIMNLSVNARDAMPKGGKLTLETANAYLDWNYFREHDIKGKKIGHYVMLAISDTGSGMNKETQEHIFEPFFTTKKVGKGTGLGLSTVYGVVKQNNGFIWLYSEPGQGSTFKIYLPKVKGDAEPEKREQTSVDDLSGSETVLIVEDDDSLRNFAQKILHIYGYRTLNAKNGEDAIRVCKEHDGQIALIITDVVMPKMDGRETAERLQHLYSQMKVIYMSGYTDNAIVHHGVLEPGLNFLEKPFTLEGLARKVREVLDG